MADKKKKKDKNNKNKELEEKNKYVYALIIGICIGSIVGSIITYIVMDNKSEKIVTENEQEKTTITESLSEQIYKLNLKSKVYNYIDLINEKVAAYNDDEANENKIIPGTYVLDSSMVFNLVDSESLEKIDGTPIADIDFGDDIPFENSFIVLNNKTKITECVFYIGEYQIKYDVLSTKVTKVGEEEESTK